MLACTACVLLLISALGSSVAPGSTEIIKYGDDPESARNHSGTHWTYDQAGDDWAGEDAAGNQWVCLTGKQQSPVNLPLSSAAATAIDASHKVTFELGSVVANGSNLGVTNTGHSVQVFWQDPSFAPSLSIAVQDGQPLQSTLDLQSSSKVSTVKAVPQQLHFHTHSEHLLEGSVYPLEAHLVSVVQQSDLPACPASGCIVVMAVMFELADQLTQDNTWLALLFDQMPYKEGEVVYLPSGTTLALQQLLPSNTSYMAYSGSLTTPPCTEGVLWLVLLNTQRLSLQQWRNFMKAVADYNCTLDGSSDSGQHYLCEKFGAGSNYRLPQVLKGRTLRVWGDVSTKKSYLPEDAATAASAGAIAGIVLGVSLGAGLTAGFGYWGWKIYNKRRLNKLYKLGVSDNDMLAVQQEVERQWLTATPSGGTAAVGLAAIRRASNTNIPL